MLIKKESEIGTADFKESFEKIVLNSFSYYDVSVNNGENFYHAIVMGLIYNCNGI